MGVSCKSSVHSLPQGREFYGRRRRRSSCVKQTHSRSPQTNENRKLYKYNNFVRSEQQLVVFEKDKNRTQPQPFEKKRKGKKTVTKRLARWINPIQRNYNCWEGRRQKEYNEIGRSRHFLLIHYISWWLGSQFSYILRQELSCTTSNNDPQNSSGTGKLMW